jgi:hypothetical protein
MLTLMSETPNRDPRALDATETSGVLANLPRARPQRASSRRARARAAGASKPSANARRASAATAGGLTDPPGNTAVKTRGKASTRGKLAGKRPAPRTGVSKPPAEPVPAQGYECDGDSLRGPIQPPGGAELVSSIAELAGELAKAGVSTGAHLVKDLLSHLPG